MHTGKGDLALRGILYVKEGQSYQAKGSGESQLLGRLRKDLRFKAHLTKFKELCENLSLPEKARDGETSAMEYLHTRYRTLGSIPNIKMGRRKDRERCAG